MTSPQRFDLIVVGGGPAGQKAAIQGAKGGWQVLLVEREPCPGGACVRRGTIPSKTLHESASLFRRMRGRDPSVFPSPRGEELPLRSLMMRVEQVIEAHEGYMTDQLIRNDVIVHHGLARFLDPHCLEIVRPGGGRMQVRGETIVLATGSKPRDPDDVPVDHENILDSDSILSLHHLPKSLIVLGSGVIASEYASIFATFGVDVTMVDKYPSPLGFLDEELVTCFLDAFRGAGGRFLGGHALETVEFDGVSQVRVSLDGGDDLMAEKCLFALGRVAQTGGLGLENAGIEVTERGHIPVDARYRTPVPHILAVGDVIGPPALAATSMEQGRRAVAYALGLEGPQDLSDIPVGIYTVPEISRVGISVRDAEKAGRSILVGRARFSEIARGQIAGMDHGLLRLIADENTCRLLGVEALGEGATELVHMGQIAIKAGWSVDTFVEDVFNFPTMAEAYRVAALDIVEQRGAPSRAPQPV